MSSKNEPEATAKPKLDRLVSQEDESGGGGGGGGGDDDWGTAGGDDGGGDAGGDDGWGAAGDGNDDANAETGSDEKTGNKKLKLSRSVSYTILEGKTAKQRKKDTVSELVTDLCVSEAEADVMLRAYRWNVKKLKEDWYDTGKGKVFCFAKAGDKPQQAQPAAAAKSDAKNNSSSSSAAAAAPPNAAAKALAAALGRPVPGSAPAKTASPAAVAAPTVVAGKTVQCQMAFCDVVPIEKAFALSCGHWFCHDCWTSMLSNAIVSGRGCVFLPCPGFICTKKDCQHSVKKGGCKCEQLIPEAIWRRFITDKALLDKFESWCLESFVEGNKHYRFCARPGCDRVAEYKKGGSREIRCTCGKEFCFACRRDPHNPAPCDLVAKWYEQGDSDKATQDLIEATAKACPSCKVLITKDRACNHMNCANCKHQFCWLCKGAWSEHGSATGGYYVCKKYQEDQKSGKKSKEEELITEKTKLMQKYMFFRQHFEHNKSAMGMAKKMLVKVEMANQGDKYNFLEDALQKVIMCRHMLQWTYALSYFMKNSSGKNLFEMQQTLLNNFTEETQELMEKHDNFEKLLELTLRKQLVTKAKLIADYAEKTIHSIEEGELVSILMYEADEHSSGGWTCTACQYTHEGHVESSGSKKIPPKKGGKDGKDDAKDNKDKKDTAADITLSKVNKNIKYKGTATKSEHEKYAGELYCAMCSACRAHGEQDCKACKPKSGTGWGF